MKTGRLRVLALVAIACVLVVFAVGAWWLEGNEVCAGYMATYDLASGACYGGKLVGQSYAPALSEQLSSTFEYGLVYGALLGLLVAIIAFRKFLRGARSILKGHER